ncbi:MAG: hypothetical protein ACRDU0_02645, partial [Mycobacterium sp.]
MRLTLRALAALGLAATLAACSSSHSSTRHRKIKKSPQTTTSTPRASVVRLWPTYLHDAGRSGYDPSAPAIGQSVSQAWVTSLPASAYA